MDLVIKNAIENFQKNNGVVVTEKNKKKIYEQFPVPREQKILWATHMEKNKIFGMVITDVGIFFKASPAAVKQANEGVSKKNQVSSIYHYFRWEFFNPDDFELKKSSDDRFDIYFNGKRLFGVHESDNFFKAYNDSYETIIKEAAVSAENIFADLEAVVPENFARVNSKHGHGEMAEEALTLLDKLQGRKAEVVGRTNEKNGADRIVDGIEIQTKYYQTGKSCIDACFDKSTGQFRYQTLKGEPMMIEVPKDKYAEAINEFRKKILEGQVPGVKDPNDASKYIKKGQLTYQQALNLCKPGTIESLTYDALTGAVYCSYAFGISFLSTYILSYSKTGDKKEAFNTAFAAGIQVFGLSFFSHVLTQQVARTTVTKQLIPLSTYIVQAMGYKSVQTIVNAIRSMAGKTAISGAAAMKHLAKMLRSNVVSSAITFAVFSIPDTYNTFRKRLSSAQYTKNMLSLIGTMATAGAGSLAASLATAKIGAVTGTTVAPGVGTAIGTVGGFVGGLVGGTAIKAVGDHIREDDTVIISRMYNGVVVNLIYEYMLSESEIDVLIEKFDGIKAKEFKELFAKVQAADVQEAVIDKFVRHYFEEIIRTRPRLQEPKPEEFVEFFKQFEIEAEIDNMLNSDETVNNICEMQKNNIKAREEKEMDKLLAKYGIDGDQEIVKIIEQLQEIKADYLAQLVDLENQKTLIEETLKEIEGVFSALAWMSKKSGGSVKAEETSEVQQVQTEQKEQSVQEDVSLKEMYEEAMELVNGDEEERGIALLKELAEKEYAEAQYSLGESYYYGWGEEEDEEEAVKWYRKAAEQDHAEAQYSLGEIYRFGFGVEEDEVEAVKWYRKAAKQDHADAQYSLGECYHYGWGVEEDEEEAVKWYRKAAEQDGSVAQYSLGECYHYGWGVEEDNEEAVKWYRKAAEHDFCKAQYSLGECYYYGWGVKEDAVKAVEWYKKAVEQEFDEARIMLGVCYYKGEGVKQDKRKGLRLITEAAKRGNKYAQCLLGLFAFKETVEFVNINEPDEIVLDEKDIYWIKEAARQDYDVAQCLLALVMATTEDERDEDEIVDLLKKAAESGNDLAKLLLASCYAGGIGVKENKAKALQWYKKVEDETDDVLIQILLARLYEEEDEEKRAFRLYMKAAEGGEAYAQCKVGECYCYGNGVTENEKTGVMWYRKAAEQGYAAAQYELGYCYEMGMGVKENEREARKWYRKAAEQGYADAMEEFDDEFFDVEEMEVDPDKELFIKVIDKVILDVMWQL